MSQLGIEPEPPRWGGKHSSKELFEQPVSNYSEHLHVKQRQYTVTKANQNEALLWKVAVLGKEKPPVGAGTFFPSPTLVFYNPPCRKCLPEWRNVKYQRGPGKRCSRTNRELFHSQNCNLPEKSLIVYIFFSPTQGNHGLGV
jgi:hypothetical protein